MPSQPDTVAPRICFFGDSQLGSLRNALREGLTQAPTGAHVEFWGATGPAFRQIEWRGGAIRAKGDALDMALTINGNRREFLAPDDFDTFIFYGARYRVSEFFGPYLQWMGENGHAPSRAVRAASGRMFAECTRAYRMAQQLAKAGRHVIYVPAPFYTDGIKNLDAPKQFLGLYPAAAQATEAQRDIVWSTLCDVAAQDGIHLVCQPEDTVTRGALTCTEYACADAKESGDIGHKSPAFAARWMEEVWPLITPARQAA